MSAREVEIPAAELEVLKVLWDHGPLTVRGALDELKGRGRDIAYTTVLTLLSRLEQRGVVASDKSGQAYVYRATLSRDRVIGTRLKGVVRQLFDGAAAPMVLHLMETERFSAEEIAELRRVIDELDRRNKPTN